MLGALLLVGLVAQGGTAAIPPASQVEGRPDARDTSPVQSLIDAAAPGSTVTIEPGDYVGDLVIDRSLHFIGRGRPRLVGSGNGSVVRVRAADVTVEGFDIDGRGGGSLSRDSAGIHVAAPRAVIRDCRISRALFGIYLREADDVRLEGNVIEGMAGKEPGDQGSGIHLWNTNGFTLTGNRVHASRDGIYLQSSSRGHVSGNTIADVRYGLHYMFSDDNVFEDNLFEQSAAGAALMYSRHIVLRRNRFLHNRGFASVGILLQACDQVMAEDNLIDDNARGVFLEGTHGDTFRRNVISTSDVALVMYDSAAGTTFEGNAFVGNLSPLQLVGRRTDTVFDRNFWSSATDADLDGDGTLDRPYRLSNVFDHLRGNLTAADLFAQGLGAAVLARAEETFPVLNRVSVEDAHPLARAPHLPNVPRAPERNSTGTAWGLGASAAGLLAGLAVVASGRRRSTGPAR